MQPLLFIIALIAAANANYLHQATLTTLQQLSEYGIPILEYAHYAKIANLSRDVLHNLLYHKIVVVNIGTSDIESNLMQQITNNIGIAIDQSIHFQGQYLWDVNYNESLFQQGALGNGLNAFDFHSENAFDPAPVRYFGMHYLNNNETFGGENQFISVNQISQFLTRDEILRLFEINVAFKAPDLFKKASNHSFANDTIFFSDERINTCIRFRHSVVLRKYTSKDMLDLVDKIHDIILNISNRIPLLIIPQNTILFWDNWYFLHSRKTILDSKRHLRRILFNTF